MNESPTKSDSKARASSILFVTLIVFGTACVPRETRPEKRMMEQMKKELIETINDIYRVGQKGDVGRLAAYHFNNPSFSRFNHDGTRWGIEKTNQEEGAFFSDRNNQFQYTIIDPKVSFISKESAVVTYYIDYSASFDGQGLESKDFVTFVMIKEEDKWKILHEHFGHMPGYPKPVEKLE